MNAQILKTARKLFLYYKRNGIARCLCTDIQPEKLEFVQATKRVKIYGQPTHHTHEHLIKRGEITPGIERKEFEERRAKLMQSIIAYSQKMYPQIQRHLVLVPAATKKYMSDKIPYVFRQNSDFLYLTGCQEPDSCFVMISEGGRSQPCSTLFMREKDDHSEMWDGPRTGPTEAVNIFGVNQSLPITELSPFLESYYKSNKTSILWYNYLQPPQETIHQIVTQFITRGQKKLWESPSNLIHQLRLIKSEAEIRLMKKSCDIASEAIVKTIERSKPAMDEHQLFATVDYECRMRGADYLAYPPVVAGGERANIIHYINNNQKINNGDMVLMDAGCEYHGYTSDITRTWPVNGKFTNEQRCLYEAVLDTQIELIKLCRQLPSLDHLFDAMCLLLGKNLKQIGLISGHLTSKSLMKAAFEFCPHHVSHYLGMDVHDTPTVTRSIKLVPGMTVTVEPGIYITNRIKNIPKEFSGLGIRIEDDILITEDGPIVLTKKCPKSVDEIEALASKNT